MKKNKQEYIPYSNVKEDSLLDFLYKGSLLSNTNQYDDYAVIENKNGELVPANMVLPEIEVTGRKQDDIHNRIYNHFTSPLIKGIKTASANNYYKNLYLPGGPLNTQSDIPKEPIYYGGYGPEIEVTAKDPRPWYKRIYQNVKNNASSSSVLDRGRISQSGEFFSNVKEGARQDVEKVKEGVRKSINTAAMADNAPVMMASGYDVNDKGYLTQIKTEDPGVVGLRERLFDNGLLGAAMLTGGAAAGAMEGLLLYARALGMGLYGGAEGAALGLASPRLSTGNVYKDAAIGATLGSGLELLPSAFNMFRNKKITTPNVTDIAETPLKSSINESSRHNMNAKQHNPINVSYIDDMMKKNELERIVDLQKQFGTNSAISRGIDPSKVKEHFNNYTLQYLPLDDYLKTVKEPSSGMYYPSKNIAYVKIPPNLKTSDFSFIRRLFEDPSMPKALYNIDNFGHVGLDNTKRGINSIIGVGAHETEHSIQKKLGLVLSERNNITDYFTPKQIIPNHNIDIPYGIGQDPKLYDKYRNFDNPFYKVLNIDHDKYKHLNLDIQKSIEWYLSPDEVGADFAKQKALLGIDNFNTQSLSKEDLDLIKKNILDSWTSYHSKYSNELNIINSIRPDNLQSPNINQEFLDAMQKAIDIKYFKHGGNLNKNYFVDGGDVETSNTEIMMPLSQFRNTENAAEEYQNSGNDYLVAQNSNGEVIPLNVMLPEVSVTAPKTNFNNQAMMRSSNINWEDAKYWGGVAGEAALGLVPIVGTGLDAYRFYKDPSWYNAGMLGLGAVSDFLLLSGIGSAAGASIKSYKAAKAAAKAAELASLAKAEVGTVKGASKVAREAKLASRAASKEARKAAQKASKEIEIIKNNNFSGSEKAITGFLTDIGIETSDALKEQFYDGQYEDYKKQQSKKNNK